MIWKQHFWRVTRLIDLYRNALQRLQMWNRRWTPWKQYFSCVILNGRCYKRSQQIAYTYSHEIFTPLPYIKLWNHSRTILECDIWLHFGVFVLGKFYLVTFLERSFLDVMLFSKACNKVLTLHLSRTWTTCNFHCLWLH